MTALFYVCAFFLLCFNVAVPCLVKYNTTRSKYIVSTTVLFTEVFKLVFALCAEIIRLYQHAPLSLSPSARLARACKHLARGFYDTTAIASTSIPALLYSVQNNITNRALALLPLQTFILTYQLRIPATALFTVLLLGQNLTTAHWCWVALLTFGVGLANWRPSVEQAASSVEHAVTATPTLLSDLLLGFFFIFVAAVLSGFSSVFMEALSKGMLKGAPTHTDPLILRTMKGLSQEMGKLSGKMGTTGGVFAKVVNRCGDDGLANNEKRKQVSSSSSISSPSSRSVSTSPLSSSSSSSSLPASVLAISNTISNEASVPSDRSLPSGSSLLSDHDPISLPTPAASTATGPDDDTDSDLSVTASADTTPNTSVDIASDMGSDVGRGSDAGCDAHTHASPAPASDTLLLSSTEDTLPICSIKNGGRSIPTRTEANSMDFTAVDADSVSATTVTTPGDAKAVLVDDGATPEVVEVAPVHMGDMTAGANTASVHVDGVSGAMSASRVADKPNVSTRVQTTASAAVSTVSATESMEPMVSVYLRNIYLAGISVLVCSLLLVWDAPAIANGGLTRGYTPIVWLTLLIQATAGLLIAWVIHHSGNIFKCFLSAASIVVTVIVDAMMGEEVPFIVVIGCICVAVATTGYLLQPKPTLTYAKVEKQD